MATEEIDFNLNDFDEQLTPCTFDSQFFDSDENGENSQLFTDSEKSSSVSKKEPPPEEESAAASPAEASRAASVEPAKAAAGQAPVKAATMETDRPAAKSADSAGEPVRAPIKETFTTESWSKFTGLKARQFTPSEMDAFKKPFTIGWRRELTVRDSQVNPAKKTVEVFYYSPCGAVKLRSYVEMGMFFRTSQDGELEPENFTFAKQPIYRQPEESLISQLRAQNGIAGVKAPDTKDAASLPQPSSMTRLDSPTPGEQPKPEPIRSVAGLLDRRASATSDDLASMLSDSLVEGRTKRRRNAPTRFEDEDYSEQSPFKKKVRIPGTSAPTPTPTPTSTSSRPSLAPKVLTGSQHKLTTNGTAKETKETLTKKPGGDAGSAPEMKITSHPNDEPTDTKKPQPDESKPVKQEPSVASASSKAEMLGLSELLQSSERSSKTSAQAVAVLLPSTAAPSSSMNGARPTNGKKPKSQMTKCTAKPKQRSVLPRTDVKQEIRLEFRPDIGFDLQPDVQLISSIDPSAMVPQDPESSDDGCISQNFIPPCSMMCGSLQGDLPSLLCSRCLCLFHPECVSKGIYLKQSSKFVCPNCIQPSDHGRAANERTGAQSSQPTEPTMQAMQTMEKLLQSSRNRPASVQPSLLLPRLEKSILKPSMNGKSKFTSLLMQSLDRGKKNPAQLAAGVKASPSLASLLQRTTAGHSSAQQAQSKPISTLHPILNSALNQQRHPQAQQPAARKQGAAMANGIPLRQTQQKPTQILLLQPARNSGTNLTVAKQQATNSANDRNGATYANRRCHLDNLNRSLLSSQQLLQSLHKLTASSLAAKQVSLNSAFMRLRKPTRHRCRDYMNSKCAGLDSLLSGYNALQLVFDHLPTKDLMRCKLVNRSFYQLASQRNLWKVIRLKNLRIRDWARFGTSICDQNAVELCFDGLRPCNDESTDQMWENAASIFRYLASVRRLSFGRLPVSFVVKLLDHAQADGTFDQLEELSIRNLFDDQPCGSSCQLRFVQRLDALPALSSLRIGSLNGVTAEHCCLEQLRGLSRFVPRLRGLFLPSLKGFSVQHFDFLEQLEQLERLEIGSCESWITCDALSDAEPTEPTEPSAPASEAGEAGQEPKPAQQVHKGAFRFLSRLRNLRELKLLDVIVDETSNQFPLAMQQMPELESLELDGVTVSPDATQTLNMLCNTMKTRLRKLRRFGISTDDSHTNRCVFELLLKRLDQLQELRWKVGSQVDDSGMCCVPFNRETEIESDPENESHMDLTIADADGTEMMEMCYLNDVLQKHLRRTRISILPQ